MPTPGFEPYQLLWDLFQQNGNPGNTVLTPEQRRTVGSIIDHVMYPQHNTEGSPLAVGFKRLMLEKTGKTLDPLNEPVVEGVLECLTTPLYYAEPIRRGVHDHFKGGVYLVTDFSLWASGAGEQVIEYTSMLFGTRHTRLASQWAEVVQWPDGKYRSRFVYRGPDLKTAEPSYKVPSPQV